MIIIISVSIGTVSDGGDLLFQGRERRFGYWYWLRTHSWHRYCGGYLIDIPWYNFPSRHVRFSYYFHLTAREVRIQRSNSLI